MAREAKEAAAEVARLDKIAASRLAIETAERAKKAKEKAARLAKIAADKIAKEAAEAKVYAAQKAKELADKIAKETKEIIKKVDIETKYEKADVFLGGVLPGGITPAEIIKSKEEERAAQLAKQQAQLEIFKEKIIEPVVDIIKPIGEVVGTIVSPISTVYAETEKQKEFREVVGGPDTVGFTPIYGGALVETSTAFGQGTTMTSYKAITKEDIEQMPFGGSEFIMSTIERELQSKVSNKGREVEQQLTDKYTQLMETQSTSQIKKWDKYIEGDNFTGTPTQYENYMDDYNKQTAINQLLSSDINDKFSKEYQNIMTTFQDKELASAEKWLDTTLKDQRRTRMLKLAPLVFVESAIMGFGISKAIGGIAKISTGLGKAASAGVGTAFIAPIVVSAPELITSAKEDPFAFAGEVVPMLAGFGVGGALAGGLGKGALPKVETLEIPQAGGGKVDVKLLGFETSTGKALILGSKVEGGKIKVGTPDIKPLIEKFPHMTDIKIGSAMETKVLQKGLTDPKIKTTEAAKGLIPVAQELLVKTVKTESKFIEKAGLKEATERLSPKAVEVVLDIAKVEEGVLFGSKSRAAQLAKEFEIKGKKYELTKVPVDIEVRFDTASDIKLKEITATTIKEFKKLGKQEVGGKIIDLSTARTMAKDPLAIEAKIGKDYVKVVEYKSGGGKLEGEFVPEYVVGIKKVGEPIKIGETKVTSLAEELRGVTQGVLRVRRLEGSNLLDIGPSPKRLKDIGSVSVAARTLEMSKPSTKLKITIEKFESFFPPELVKKQITEVLKTPEKIKIADYSVAKTITPKPITIISPSVSKAVSPGVSPYISPSISKVVSPEVSPYVSPSISKVVSPTVSPAVSPYVSPKVISPTVSPSVSPYISPKIVSPSVSPYVSPKVSPYTSPSVSPYVSPKVSPSVSPYYTGKPTKYSPKMAKKKRIIKRRRKPKTKVYTGEIRRQGKWKPVYKGKKQEVITKTKRKISTELGARLRVRAPSGKYMMMQTSKEFRRSKAKSTPHILIEKRKYRLNTPGEKGEIKRAKKAKKAKSMWFK